MADVKEQQLWCIDTNRPGLISRFPLTEGIAGQVVKTGAIQNIQKIRHDRVHSRLFERTHQVTYQNVLALPVKDSQNQGVLAVLECVNKATEGVFTNIDKTILELSSGFALYLVTQRLQKSQEESVLILNRLRHVLNSGMLFNNVNEIGPLMTLAEERMMTGINSLECIFYHVESNDRLVRYVYHNNTL